MRGRGKTAPAAAETAPSDWDALQGVRPPRRTETTLGQEDARAAFDDAWTAGRRHHAWLLRGPRGVGKASFAYGIARRVFAETAADAPDRIQSLIAAGSHPGLFELRRGFNEKTKKPRTAISVDDVRRLIGFFQLSAPDQGWRVALIDPADDLTLEAANALLKLLEEPPARALFLLVAHAAGRLPATLRSRCRRLDFAALSAYDAAEAMRAATPELSEHEAMALAILAEGAPGEALRLRGAGGFALYDAVLAFLEGPAEPDRQKPLVEAASRRDVQPPGLETLSRLVPLALARVARARYRGAAERRPLEVALPQELEVAGRLCATDQAARVWAEAAVEARDRLEAAAGLNLDPARSILDTALYLDDAARRARAA